MGPKIGNATSQRNVDPINILPQQRRQRCRNSTLVDESNKKLDKNLLRQYTFVTKNRQSKFSFLTKKLKVLLNV